LSCRTRLIETDYISKSSKHRRKTFYTTSEYILTIL